MYILRRCEKQRNYDAALQIHRATLQRAAVAQCLDVGLRLHARMLQDQLHEQAHQSAHGLWRIRPMALAWLARARARLHQACAQQPLVNALPALHGGMYPRYGHTLTGVAEQSQQPTARRPECRTADAMQQKHLTSAGHHQPHAPDAASLPFSDHAGMQPLHAAHAGLGGATAGVPCRAYHYAECQQPQQPSAMLPDHTTWPDHNSCSCSQQIQTQAEAPAARHRTVLINGDDQLPASRHVAQQHGHLRWPDALQQPQQLLQERCGAHVQQRAPLRDHNSMISTSSMPFMPMYKQAGAHPAEHVQQGQCWQSGMQQPIQASAPKPRKQVCLQHPIFADAL